MSFVDPGARSSLITRQHPRVRRSRGRPFSSAAVALAFFLVAGTTLAAQPARLNFVVIMADDLGAQELGCYGSTKHRTPRLDRLASEGMRFRTCYATPICSPTRIMIMSGRYGFRTGWYNFIGRQYSPEPDSPEYDIGTHEITFADVLKPAGYKTGIAGKWQLPGTAENRIFDCGFDEYCMWIWLHNLQDGATHTGGWEGPGKPSRYWHPGVMVNGKYRSTEPVDYGPHIYNEFVIDFIRRHRDEPFCVYYPMCLIHKPWKPTPSLDEPGTKTDGGLKNNVEYMDHLVGRVVDTLDELGLRENTLVLFTGDNGTGNAGKGTSTELGARVPLIVSRPGFVPPGVVSDELVDLTDVLPTLAELAGAKLPSDRTIDGRSLAATLQGKDVAHREWIFSYLGADRILRDKRWLREGDGRFFDCGASRDGTGYKDVTESQDPEVVEAKQRFEKLLEELPGPKEDQVGNRPAAGDAERTSKVGKKKAKVRRENRKALRSAT